ncbi:transketolase [Haematospirillum jordaniae]|uniref:Transketolase n=1 Tax=Haematospirillum jordaniae TaxID=1549855 RepID=A0A143DF26_9PROT|nr:transketolase [Haematospirillum jordaniae]AMW35341.1 transketolase [Haematospirillum jordaniae]NKD45173.1 transketolase [Haematospirillum jordaniae]NKD56242.1 transketolase [Haematospirillum jordaniae]NKD58299.1 transketolase [Haematospirillum jordaniae]NKD66530.1 transketolase [Haematospirillum jordaniae]
MSTPDHAEMANAIRFLAADAVQKANSGHPGMPMGMADVATVLFTRFLKFDSSAPRWADRDRFILSAGHGSMLLYSLGYLLGYEDVTLDQVKAFRQFGAITAGHPEYGHVSLAETTTGPLGQGIANAVGFALAEKMMAARHGRDVVDHWTYVIAGDGCLMEGLSQEAITMAGHWKLNRLVVLWDDNAISIDGQVSLATSEDQHARFRAAGWNTIAVDGHDPEAVAAAIEGAKKSDRPTLIACKTVIGFGAPTLAGSEKTHGAPLGDVELAGARAKLGWNCDAFDIPAPVLSAWRKVGQRGRVERQAWDDRVSSLPDERRVAFLAALSGALPEGWEQGLIDLKTKAVAEKTKVATRKASQMALDAIAPFVPSLIGGSADLTHSNLTLAKGMMSVLPDDASGNYIHYGVREHGMAAVMNGLALHGGFIPYGGTFLVFADYARPAIRMAALMGIRVVYVMTHDSIGLGEDGPTHQPVEHLVSLRAMPNLLVFRPADIVETAECWQLALETTTGPSLLALSRQNLPCLRDKANENQSARGAYILAEAADGVRDVTLLATGSEVEIAMSARESLAGRGVRAAVVSMPCQELFDAQTVEYRRSVLGDAPRVAVEAAATLGWERYVGLDGAIVGMKSFGASAPAADLYRHFGITAEAVAAEALRVVA